MTVEDLASKDAAAKAAAGKRAGEIPVKIPEPSVNLSTHTPANERKQVGTDWALTQQGAKACWKYYKEQGLQIPLVASSPHTTSLATSGHVVQPADGTATSTVSLTTVGEIITSQSPDPPETPFSSSTLVGPSMNSAGDFVGPYIRDDNAGTDYPMQPGRATSFDGVNDALKATITPAATYPFTMMGWVFADSNTSSYNPFGISSDASTNYIRIFLQSGGTRVRFIRNDGTSDTDGMDVNGPLSLNEWHHLAVVFHSATHVTIYIDGYPHFDDNAMVSKTPTGLDTIGIGCYWNNTVANTPWAGDLFDIRLYDRVMTAAEVNNIIKDPVANLYATDLLGHWRLDDQLEYFDTSGAGNHATATDSPAVVESADVPASFDNVLGGSIPASTWYPARSDNTALDTQGNSLDTPGPLAGRLVAKASTCLSFDGTNDHLESAMMQPDLTNLSVTAWVYWDTNMTGGIYSNYDWASSQRGLEFYLEAGGELNVNLSSTGSTAEKTRDTNQTVPLTTWTHVAFTFAPNDLKMYIDGVECTYHGFDNTANTINGDTAKELLIGARYNDGVVTNQFPGDMADVRVYHRTLSATEVADIAAGKLGHTSGQEPKYWWPMSDGYGMMVQDAKDELPLNMYLMNVGSWSGTQDKFNYAGWYGSGRAANNAEGDGVPLISAPTHKAVISTQSAGAWQSAAGTTCQNTGNFLVVTLCKPYAPPGTGVIASRWDNNTHEEWRIYINAANDSFYAQATPNGTSASSASQAASTITPGSYAWDMVAMYHDTGDAQLGISVNGAAASVTSLASVYTSNTVPFVIGGEDTASNSFEGEIAHVAVFAYGGAIEPATIISALWNSGTPLKYSDLTAQNKTDWGLTNWWQADDLGHTNTWDDVHASATLTHSVNGAKVNFAITGGDNSWPNSIATLDFTGGVATPWSTKNYLGYYTYNSTQNGVSVWDAFSGVDFSGGTMTGYARLRNPSTATVNCVLIGAQSSTADVNRLEFFYFRDETGTDEWQMYQNGSTVRIGSGYAYPTDGEWHDYVFQINGTAVTFFLDGTQVGTATLAESLSTSAAGWTQANLGSAGASVTGNKFEGEVARIVFSNSIQSPYQMQQADPTDSFLDLRFDGKRILDTKGRVDPQLLYTTTGRTAAVSTVPTAYSYGDALGDGLSKTGEGSYTIVNKDQ